MAHPGRQHRLRRTPWLPASLVLLCVGAVATATLVPGPAGVPMPDRLAGLAVLPSVRGDVADRLVDRLRAEAAVSAVGVARYGGEDRSVVVLKVLPREPFTDRSAGELTARMLAEVGSRRGATTVGDPTTDAVSATSEDGLALMSCTVPRPQAPACVTVEEGQALLVLASGWDGDPLGLAAAVRDEVGPPPEPDDPSR